MTLPTIHLNGSGPARLLAELIDASAALSGALAALKRGAPNARDYYPQGPGAYQAAADEHMDRMRRVAAVQDEIDALAQHVAQFTI